ncbi:class I SAM-dependent methyltransferase [Caproicibacter sp.]|uniref:class I SAM-dependent methyltransferase n=1 Tax=Caproicibacter sp. TaxID=2814884 RepID=UPI00398A2DE8
MSFTASDFRISEHWANYETGIENPDGFLQFKISDFVKATLSLIVPNGCILDLGCGDGRHSFYFYRHGFHTYAADINCKSIRKNCSKLGFTALSIKEYSFTKIPEKANFFDAVYCMSALHHACRRDIVAATGEIYRVLAPGGIFVFDFLTRYDSSYGLGREIEENTFLGSREGEAEIPHHYTDEKEIETLTSDFSDVKVQKSIYSYTYDGRSLAEKVFDVIAVK